uniref:Uncharacterized protein n=1 Tax=Plectus sambesii TaxID=2011161 RepID=A0A914WDW6_9BILA
MMLPSRRWSVVNKLNRKPNPVLTKGVGGPTEVGPPALQSLDIDATSPLNNQLSHAPTTATCWSGNLLTVRSPPSIREQEQKSLTAGIRPAFSG